MKNTCRAVVLLVAVVGLPYEARAVDLLSSDPSSNTSGDALLSSDPSKNTSGDRLLSPGAPKTKSKPNLLLEGAPKTELSTKDPDLCLTLVRQTARPDVAYQGGVDAEGHAVAGADVAGAPQMQLPSKIQIPLTTSLVKTLNLNTSQYPYSQLGPSTEAVLGTLTVEGNSVSFNGKPLSDEQQNNLSVLCMKKNASH